jgi:hypothetical protein
VLIELCQEDSSATAHGGEEWYLPGQGLPKSN